MIKARQLLARAIIIIVIYSVSMDALADQRTIDNQLREIILGNIVDESDTLMLRLSNENEAIQYLIRNYEQMWDFRETLKSSKKVIWLRLLESKDNNMMAFLDDFADDMLDVYLTLMIVELSNFYLHYSTILICSENATALRGLFFNYSLLKDHLQKLKYILVLSGKPSTITLCRDVQKFSENLIDSLYELVLHANDSLLID